MNIIASRILGNSTVCMALYLCQNQERHQITDYWPFMTVIHWWLPSQRVSNMESISMPICFHVLRVPNLRYLLHLSLSCFMQHHVRLLVCVIRRQYKAYVSPVRFLCGQEIICCWLKYTQWCNIIDSKWVKISDKTVAAIYCCVISSNLFRILKIKEIISLWCTLYLLKKDANTNRRYLCRVICRHSNGQV